MCKENDNNKYSDNLSLYYLGIKETKKRNQTQDLSSKTTFL